jgi:hypothetical protein
MVCCIIFKLFFPNYLPVVICRCILLVLTVGCISRIEIVCYYFDVDCSVLTVQIIVCRCRWLLFVSAVVGCRLLVVDSRLSLSFSVVGAQLWSI